MGIRFSDDFIKLLNELSYHEFCNLTDLQMRLNDVTLKISEILQSSNTAKTKIVPTISTKKFTLSFEESNMYIKDDSELKRAVLTDSIVDRLLYAYKNTVEIQKELYTINRYMREYHIIKVILQNLQTRLQEDRDNLTTKVPDENNAGDEVPLVDLYSASSNELKILLHLFTGYPVYEEEFSHLLQAVSKFIPHIKIEKLPDQRFNQSHCSKCSINIHQRFCQVCREVFCQTCIYKRKIPQLNMFSPNSVCGTCYQILDDQDAEKWAEEGLKLIYSKELDSVVVAHGYFMIALCYGIDASKLLYNISKAFADTQHPEMALKFITNVFENCDDITFIKALLLAGSILKILALQPERNFSEQWTLMKSAESACLEAESIFTTTCNYKLDIPDMFTKKNEIMEAMQSLYSNQKDKFYLDTCNKFQKGWENRNFTEILSMITSKQSLILYFKDCFITILENFLNTKYKFFPNMIDEDVTALSFLQGVLQLLKGESNLAMKTIEEAVWNNYHTEWMQQDAINLILALDSSFSLPHKKLGAMMEYLNADYLLSGDIKKLSMLVPNMGESYDLKLHWPKFYLIGVNTKASHKYEQAAIKLFQQGRWNEWDVGLAYLDFIPSCKYSAEFCVCLLTAGLWFLKTLQKVYKDTTKECGATINTSSKEVKEACVVKEAILKCVQFSLHISHRDLHPGMQLYVSQKAFKLVLTASRFSPSQITEYESNLIAQLLQSICHYSRFCLFWNTPQVSLSEAILLEITSGQLHSKFMISLQHVKQKQLMPISDSELKYQIYENDLRNLCPLEDSADAHLQAMESLLKEKGWSLNDVTDLMVSPFSPRTKSGWLIQQPYLEYPMEYASLEGFQINIDDKNPSIQLFVKLTDDKNVGLFSQYDIGEAIALKSSIPAYFSLDHPNEHQRFHPFQEFQYEPDNLKNSYFLHTMFEADYLLKSFSVGVEVSCIPPFKQRPCTNVLIANLPKRLQEILKPVSSRGPVKSKLTSFWIQVDEIIYDVKERNGVVIYKLKQPKMIVRTHPFVYDLDGKLKYSAEDEDPNSPMVRFAADISANYDEIGHYFPMFARLKELVKVRFFGHVICSIIADLKQKSEGIGINISEKVYQEHLKKNNSFHIKHIDDCLNDLKCQCTSAITDITKLPYSQQTSALSSLCANVASKLINSCQGNATYSNIRNYVELWLADISGGFARRVWNYATQRVSSLQQLANYMVECIPILTHNDIKENIIKDSQKKYSCLSQYISRLKLHHSISRSSCKWVPAALLLNSTGIHTSYGGVMLCPKLVIIDKIDLPDETKSVTLMKHFSGYPKCNHYYQFHAYNDKTTSKQLTSLISKEGSISGDLWSPLIKFDHNSDIANICDKQQFTSTLYGGATSSSTYSSFYNYSTFRKYVMGIQQKQKDTLQSIKAQKILLHSKLSFINKKFKPTGCSHDDPSNISRPKQEGTQFHRASRANDSSTTGGCNRYTGGGDGGGRGASRGGGSSKDMTKDSLWCYARGKKWEEIKNNAMEKGQFGKDRYYYKVNTDRGLRWFSFDHAGHAGSAFKGYTETKSQLIFESSYDHNLQIMLNRHESNEGITIKKCEMKITSQKSSSKILKVFVTE